MHEINKVALQVKLDSQLKPVLSIIPVYDISMSRDIIVQGKFTKLEAEGYNYDSDSSENRYSSSEEPEIVEQADSNDDEQEEMNEKDTSRAQRIKRRQD